MVSWWFHVRGFGQLISAGAKARIQGVSVNMKTGFVLDGAGLYGRGLRGFTVQSKASLGFRV